jgi:hypothetical protein
MAIKTDQRLTKEFSKVSGSGAKADVSPIAGPGAQPKSTPTQTVAKAFNAASDTVGAAPSYRGTSGSSSSSQTTSSSGGILDTVENVGKDVMESGLGVIPLVGSLLGLFGGNAPAKPVYQKYEKPASIDFTGATVGNSLGNSDYDQLGMPRLYDTAPSDPSQGAAPAASSASPGGSGGSAGSSSSSSTPQISVNVQAMDAKSFMDYSGQIASAVRDAMLNLSSINDVVQEL